MKHSFRICTVSILMALFMCVPAFAADTDPVLFTFEGKDVLQSEIIHRTAAYAQARAIFSDTSYDEAIEYMIENQLVPQAKAEELGLDQYTKVELAAIKQEADEHFEAQLDAYVEALVPEQTEENKEVAREELRVYWAENGTTVEVAEETHLFNKTRARLLETMEVEVTDAEIQQVFEEQVAKDRDYFSDNYTAYEYFTYYQDSDVWYTPEGLRGVLQILLYTDEDLVSAYLAAVKKDEGVDEAYQAVIATKQEILDDISARLEAGEDFVALMSEYSEDPSMDQMLASEGYPVHVKSTVWGNEFAAGAFSEEMQQVGDVSSPIISKHGIHILYYLRDIPSGAIVFNDQIGESIKTYLTNQKRAEMLKNWVADYEIVYHQDAIDALMATAVVEE